MSERNGDRARFQKNRKRKLRHRQRIQTLMTGRAKKTTDPSRATPPAPPGEGGWPHSGA
jgi:hypothetical protein